MILTIGMIVKNEEKYLERCLNGIKPILDNVDSELIITDTGSTDRTVEIAHKFTDKVLHFDWINDFAAARNTAFEIAQGEWFMFLDADEIFESCDGIINFFNTGEYKKYSAAAYIVRNLLTDDNYSDFMASRMTKIYPDTRFKGRIHEYLLHFTYPIKNISDVALHYGYLFENKEQSEEKSKRNTILLKNMLEEDTDYNPLIFLHLYDSCKMSGNIPEAAQYLDKGIEYCQKIYSPYIASYYIAKVRYLMYLNDYVKVLEICDEYFHIDKSIKNGRFTTDVEIYGVQAAVLYDHLNFSEAKKSYAVFFDIYEDVKSGKLNTDDASALNFRIALDKNYIDQLNAFIECCIICKDFDTALKYLSSLPIYKYDTEKNDIAVLMDKVMTVLGSTGYNQTYECFIQLSEYGKNILVGKLLNALYNEETKAIIIEQLKIIGSEIEWLKYKADIYESYFINDDLTSHMVADYIVRFGANSDPDLLKLAMDKNIDISFFLKAEDFDIKHCTYICCKKIPGFYETAENYDIRCLTDTGVLAKAMKIYDYCISMRLMDNGDKSEEEKKQLISKLFRIKNELNERCKRENSAKSEFELLAETVKNNIKAFIAKGDIDTARKTLEDYKKINPGDPEIAEITAYINR